MRGGKQDMLAMRRSGENLKLQVESCRLQVSSHAGRQLATCNLQPATDASRRAFTLAEVLAALAFMAIVIPVAIQGLRVAGQAGEVAIRKSQAARIADKIINQSMVTTNWSTSQQTGQTIEGTTQFQWTLRNEAWKENPLRLISAEVSFMAQDKKISVRLSTLVDSTPPGAQPMSTAQ
jgi:type II secretory pathway pseudopilin PulG